MKKLTFKTTDKPLVVNVPNRLEDVTLAMMIEFSKSGLSDLEAVSAITHAPLETLYRVRDGQALIKTLIPYVQSIEHQLKYNYDAERIPSKITLDLMGGKSVTVDVVKDLSIFPMSAYMASRDIMADEINRHIELYGDANWKDNFNPDYTSCGKILAHYLYCKVYKNDFHTEEKGERFFDVVKWLPITEAGPLARYFFLKYPDLPTRKTGFWHHLRLSWKNALALRSSRRSAITTP